VAGVLVVNKPQSLRDTMKIYISYSRIIATNIISADNVELRDFIVNNRSRD